MNKKQEEFFKELLADFKVEAAEHKQTIIKGLLDLEKGLAEKEMQSLVELIFRETHSLKGAARAVSLADIERLCQTMETGFSLLKNQTISISKTFFDKMHASVDLLDQLLEDSATGNKTVKAERKVAIMKDLNELFYKKSSLPGKIQNTADSEKIQSEKIISQDLPQKEKSVATETVRISTAKLTEILLQTEELINIKNTLTHYIKEIRRITLNPKTGGDICQVEGKLKSIREEIDRVAKPMDQFSRIMTRTIDDLSLGIKNTLLLPFSSILDIFPKFVRDLSTSQKKEINFTIHGGETEIDRRILEEIKDPLIHLIRNSIDHGIETPDIRRKSGKPPKGSLILEIKQTGNREVSLQISDDGKGISRERVLESAFKNGVVSQEVADNMTDQEVFNLIFLSGLSTSPFITDLSGRGLGLAIVAEKVFRLGGSVSIDSKPGSGSVFIIILPLTVETFRGILIRIAEQYLIIPTNTIEKAIRITPSEIKKIENQDTIIFNGKNIALLRLGDILGLPYKKPKAGELALFFTLILNLGQRRMAFIVDEILDEQEGIVKMLGSQLIHVRNITGATVLGNGKIVPILNVAELMESAKSMNKNMTLTQESDRSEIESGEKKSVLVAEDSITARSLLRNILESAGYLVKTAVDGMEAFQFLQGESYDLVVSDIEMPRMNGFELTTRIRSDKKIEELPVILVTALDAPNDRQRGMECGANAYIVKSSFEQSNLLEVIKRLL